jgi:hypothetical protein
VNAGVTAVLSELKVQQVKVEPVSPLPRLAHSLIFNHRSDSISVSLQAYQPTWKVNMDVQEIAQNTFTIAALLLTASIIILNYSWKRLRTLIRTMPDGKQQVNFKLGSISDPIERDKYAYIDLQLIACVFLIFSFVGALMAVFIMSGVMVGDIAGMYAAENFEFAVVAMRVAVFCLFVGVMSSAMVYLEDLVALCTGQPSIATTRLEKLPKRAPADKVWSYILSGLLYALLITMFLIDWFVPYNQWVKMALALVAGTILFVGARFGYRLYVRVRSRRATTNQAGM